MARNPGAGGAIRAAMILGLVFVETLSLLTFVIRDRSLLEDVIRSSTKEFLFSTTAPVTPERFFFEGGSEAPLFAAISNSPKLIFHPGPNTGMPETFQ